MSFARRNHYLPQQYQRGFANSSGKVWLFDRELLKFREGVPINIGVEKDFYTVVKDGESSDVVEKTLAQVEGATWPVINKLVRGSQITEEDRIHLSLFIALMQTRTPVFEQMSSGMGNLLFQTLAKLKFRDPSELAQYHLEENGTVISEAEAIKFYKAIQDDEFFVETPRQNNIKLMLQIALQLSEAIFDMNWTIYQTDQNHTFITSDNPFLVTTTKPHDPLVGVGPLSPYAASVVPLTATTAICVQNTEGQSLSFRKANKDLVRECNKFAAAQSDRFILARDEHLLRKTVKRVNADKWRNSFVPSLVTPLA